MVRPLISALLALAVGPVLGASPAAADGTAALNKILGAAGPSESQSVMVVRLSDGKTLFEKNADQVVAPASVTKVVTSAAVLTRLTPVYTFKTQLYYTGTRKADRINGDLVVVGDGDPFLVSEKLWQLAADLRNLGIREFTGDLVIDGSLFDDESRDESRKFGTKQSRNAYDAPITAFAINFNTFAVAIAPGDHMGKPGLASLDPYALRGVSVQNEVKTGKPHAQKTIQVNRTGDGKTGEKVVATGTIAADAPLTKVYRSVGDPVQFAGEYLRAFLQKESVIVRGSVKSGKKPADATPLMTVESYDLSKIVAGLNTFSNNFIADMLVKRLGAALPVVGPADAPGSGTLAHGVAVLSDFLKKDVGITSEFVLENGSGLATENRLSAHQVVQVLAYMEKHMEVFPEFLSSLPASGWSGTLKKRFGKGDGEDMKGLFRAKSGTLTEPVTVAGLAGYFRHPTHGLVAFTVLENGIEGEAQPKVTDVREKQDQLLAAFMNQL